MKPSGVYRLAAKLAHERGACGCWAIGEALIKSRARDSEIALVGRFENLFKPYQIDWRINGGRATWFGIPAVGTEYQNHRVLALLLMSEIAKDDE